MPFTATPIELKPSEFDQLEALLSKKKHTTSHGVAERVRIVLLAAQALSNQEIVSKLGIYERHH